MFGLNKEDLLEYKTTQTSTSVMYFFKYNGMNIYVDMVNESLWIVNVFKDQEQILCETYKCQPNLKFLEII